MEDWSMENDIESFQNTFLKKIDEEAEINE